MEKVHDFYKSEIGKLTPPKIVSKFNSKDIEETCYTTKTPTKNDILYMSLQNAIILNTSFIPIKN